jgi:hypothetical protein
MIPGDNRAGASSRQRRSGSSSRGIDIGGRGIDFGGRGIDSSGRGGTSALLTVVEVVVDGWGWSVHSPPIPFCVPFTCCLQCHTHPLVNRFDVGDCRSGLECGVDGDI